MKFNLNNPAFLQAGGNKPQITHFVLGDDSGGNILLSANGSVIVEYIQDGEKKRNVYSTLSDTPVSIPVGVDATVYGEVTTINNRGAANIFSSLDVSKNTALTYLDCSGCTGLTSLDVSKNTNLHTLVCSGCTGLTSLDVSKNTNLHTLVCSNCNGLRLLDIQNTALLTEGELFGPNDANFNLTTLQVAGTSAWAYEIVESWLVSEAPDNGIIYVDENTPQAVITAAENLGWEVEYVDA